MRFGSVCSGIEAASVAWHPLGWKAAWLSEIEPFPSAVLAHHYPDVPNLGDMTALPERILSGEVEAPDVFCGGTPCQAFSVAGLRNSLDDARGNLSLTFVGIANAIDHVRSVRSDDPAIIFWENVPGVLRTKDNAFGCFLGALAGEDDPVTCPDGKWPTAGVVVGQKRAVAWRVLDAQYFGVAQRRRRVFVVASARDDFDPAAVLFEFNGVRRDTAPSREARKEVTECAGTLTANGGGLNRPAGNANELDFCVTVASAYAIQGSMIGRNDNAGPQGDGINEEVCFTQNTIDRHAVAQPIAIQDVRPIEKMQNGRGWNDDGTAYTVDTHATQGVAQPIGIFQDSEFGVAQYDSAGTLRAGRIPEHQMVMQPVGVDIFNAAFSGEVAVPLTNRSDGTGTGPTVMQSMAVRRLTPVECERLQGFPDGYTNIPWRKKDESPDGPRYKALGNSWAVPVVAWIGKRINEAVK
jgi:DNA (cytosine-5)-methyltransferase 1